MKNKLEIGMYVRTKWGIAKITEVEVVEEILGRKVQPITVYYVDRCFQPIDETKCFKEDILKTSNNIIDLIEVGDYVNGYKVTHVYPNLIKVDSTDIWEIHINDIETINTKEQFKSEMYEVKRECKH